LHEQVRKKDSNAFLSVDGLRITVDKIAGISTSDKIQVGLVLPWQMNKQNK
jgi:hypothetical protein